MFFFYVLLVLSVAKAELDMSSVVYDPDLQQLCITAFFPNNNALDQPWIDGRGLMVFTPEVGFTNFWSQDCKQRTVRTADKISSVICSRVTVYRVARLEGSVSLVDKNRHVSIDYVDSTPVMMNRSNTSYHVLNGIPYCTFYNETCNGQCQLYCEDIGQKTENPYVFCNGLQMQVSNAEVPYSEEVFPLEVNVFDIRHVPDRNLTCLNIDNITPRQMWLRFYNHVSILDYTLNFTYACGTELHSSVAWQSSVCMMDRHLLPNGGTDICYPVQCDGHLSGPFGLEGSMTLELINSGGSYQHITVRMTNVTFELLGAKVEIIENPLTRQQRCCEDICIEKCKDIARDQESKRCRSNNRTPKSSTQAVTSTTTTEQTTFVQTSTTSAAPTSVSFTTEPASQTPTPVKTSTTPDRTSATPTSVSFTTEPASQTPTPVDITRIPASDPTQAVTGSWSTPSVMTSENTTTRGVPSSQYTTAKVVEEHRLVEGQRGLPDWAPYAIISVSSVMIVVVLVVSVFYIKRKCKKTHVYHVRDVESKIPDDSDVQIVENKI